MERKVLPANDPRWSDGHYRTAKLRGLMALHDLKVADIARLTNHKETFVYHWVSGRYKTIQPATLRALEYELLVDRESALGEV